MPRISQRALVADALEYMEKDAGKGPKLTVSQQSPELLDLLSRILGSSGKSLSAGNSAPVHPAEILKNAITEGKWGDVDNISSSLVKALRKKLEQKEISKAKKLVGENKDILSETGKVLLNGGGSGKNQGLGGAAGAGAGIGAIAGAFQDTDEENTNMLGVTQKRKGGLGARLKNMAMGAAAGGAVGAGLKAKGVAKKNIGDSVKQVSKGGREALKGLRDEEVVSRALSEFSPVDIEGDLSNTLSKVYKNIQKNQKKFKDPEFNSMMDNALFNGKDSIKGLDPKYNGLLERLWDRISGGNARRKELADSTLDALISLSPMSGSKTDPMVNNLVQLRNSFGGDSIQALEALRKDPTKYIPADKMPVFKGLFSSLFNKGENVTPFGKAFQKRNRGFNPGILGDHVLYPRVPGSDTLLDWIFGKKSPERLHNYYDEVIGNIDI